MNKVTVEQDTAGINPVLCSVADKATIEHEIAHAAICVYFGGMPNYVSISQYAPCVAYPGYTPEKIGWPNMRTVFIAGLAKEYLMGVAYANDFFEPSGPYIGDYRLYTDFGGLNGAFEREFWTAVCLLELEQVMEISQKMRDATWTRYNLLERSELLRLFGKGAHDAQGHRPC